MYLKKEVHTSKVRLPIPMVGNPLRKAINKWPKVSALIVGIAGIFVFAAIGIQWLHAIVLGGIDGLLFYFVMRNLSNSN